VPTPRFPRSVRLLPRASAPLASMVNAENVDVANVVGLAVAK